MKAEAVIFMGIQATGKSTFCCQKFYKTHMRLNLDMLKTRNREDILLKACIESRQSFVIDNTNPTKESRKKYIDLASSAGFKITGYYFESKIGDSILRNETRIGKECVPVVAIKGTHSKLELPHYEEGFDALYYVKIVDGALQVEEYNNEI